MHSPTPNSLLILRWWTSCKVPAKATPCLAPTIITLAAITHGAAEPTLSIFSVAMLVWVLKDLLWTPASLVLISSRIRRFQFLFTEESTTITPSALFQERLRCVIQFLAHESRRTPGLVWVRFSAAAKEMSFTHRAHRLPLLSTRS